MFVGVKLLRCIWCYVTKGEKSGENIATGNIFNNGLDEHAYRREASFFLLFGKLGSIVWKEHLSGKVADLTSNG